MLAIPATDAAPRTTPVARRAATGMRRLRTRRAADPRRAPRRLRRVVESTAAAAVGAADVALRAGVDAPLRVDGRRGLAGRARRRASGAPGARDLRRAAGLNAAWTPIFFGLRRPGWRSSPRSISLGGLLLRGHLRLCSSPTGRRGRELEIWRPPLTPNGQPPASMPARVPAPLLRGADQRSPSRRDANRPPRPASFTSWK